MKTSFVLLAPLAALGLAAPVATATSNYEWSPELAQFYSAVDKHIQKARAQSDFPTPPTCDLSNAAMPVGPTPLPTPSAGLVLREVAVGRGIQNYTCESASPTVTPVSIGAVASLFNASCIAANYPDILSMLPTLALQFPIPATTAEDDAVTTLSPTNMDLSGHHYFQNPSTPVFNLDANTNEQLGIAVAAKKANSTAPANATPGPGGVGDGAVAWLYLTANANATIGDVRAVYRLNTAGGSPPKTCENSPAEFSVQYAAEYWFYTLP